MQVLSLVLELEVQRYLSRIRARKIYLCKKWLRYSYT